LIGDKPKNIKLIAHPQVFDRKFYEELGNIGTRMRKSEIAKYFDLNLSKSLN
jgi:metal-dependent hydrolase (beta-lactamase superfamily II)